MGAKQVLELEIKTTQTGDGVTKVTAELSEVKGGLSNFEKSIVGARSTIGGLDRDISLFGKNIGSAADALSGFGISIPQSPMALFGQVTRQVTDTLWESIQMAGDAEEQAALFQQTFREEAEATRGELEAFGDEVGRSTIGLMDMASGIQTILAPLGMTREEAANWSVTMTQLATDLGAAFNKVDADVLGDIRSGLMGSTEVMEKYGVNLKMSAINQELLNMGIAGGVQRASELEKVQARLNLIMKQTSDYQGQAARESDSFNGQMKELEANFTDLKVELGERFLPVANEVLGWFNESFKTIDVSKRFWSALDDALEQGVITQEEYNKAGKEFQRTAREGNATTDESIEKIEALEKATKDHAIATKDWGNLIELAALDAGFYADMAERAGEETGEWDHYLQGASEQMQQFWEEYQQITSLNANFSGMVSLAKQYDDVMGQINTKQSRVNQLMEIMSTGGYIDGVYIGASKAKEEIGLLEGEIGDLQGSMEDMANQVVLDMLMATIAIDGVTQAEASAYFQMAADMGMISQEAADAAIAAYSNAIDQINNMVIHPKTGMIYLNIKYNDPGFVPNVGGGGGSQQSVFADLTDVGDVTHQFEAEGGGVYPGQRLMVGELGPEPFIPSVPGQIISNRDLQNGAVGGGINLHFNGPAYFRSEHETRALIERVLVEAARG